jgi:hypothetical protein
LWKRGGRGGEGEGGSFWNSFPSGVRCSLVRVPAHIRADLSDENKTLEPSSYLTFRLIFYFFENFENFGPTGNRSDWLGGPVPGPWGPILGPREWVWRGLGTPKNHKKQLFSTVPKGRNHLANIVCGGPAKVLQSFFQYLSSGVRPRQGPP